jgi:hypothetical protein
MTIANGEKQTSVEQASAVRTTIAVVYRQIITKIPEISLLRKEVDGTN